MTRPADPDTAHDAAAVTVTVVRSGGFAGLPRRWRVEVDAGDADDWVVLIDRCPWEQCPQLAPAEPDRFTWEVAATHGTRRHHAALAEQQVSGPWRALIDAVREAAPPRPGTEPGRRGPASTPPDADPSAAPREP